MRHVSTLLLALLFVASASSAPRALTLKTNDRGVEISGRLETGDAAKFSAWLGNRYRRNAVQASFRVAFDSPGGQASEAIEIGRKIRSLGGNTIVARGHRCAGACVLAFLGGATHWPFRPWGRFLDFSAQLDLDTSPSAMSTDSRDPSTVARDAAILFYAAELGDVDVAFLARALRAPSGELQRINTPETIAAFKIEVFDLTSHQSPNWATFICLEAVGAGPVSRGIDTKALDAFAAVAINDESVLAHDLLEDRYPPFDRTGTEVRRAMADVWPIEMTSLLGSPMIHSGPEHRLVFRVALNRGKGLRTWIYVPYDSCYVGRGVDEAEVVLVDGISHAADHRRVDPIFAFPRDKPLW